MFSAVSVYSLAELVVSGSIALLCIKYGYQLSKFYHTKHNNSSSYRNSKCDSGSNSNSKSTGPINSSSTKDINKDQEKDADYFAALWDSFYKSNEYLFICIKIWSTVLLIVILLLYLILFVNYYHQHHYYLTTDNNNNSNSNSNSNSSNNTANDYMNSNNGYLADQKLLSFLNENLLFLLSLIVSGLLCYKKRTLTRLFFGLSSISWVIILQVFMNYTVYYVDSLDNNHSDSHGNSYSNDNIASDSQTTVESGYNIITGQWIIAFYAFSASVFMGILVEQHFSMLVGDTFMAFGAFLILRSECYLLSSVLLKEISSKSDSSSGSSENNSSVNSFNKGNSSTNVILDIVKVVFGDGNKVPERLTSVGESHRLVYLFAVLVIHFSLLALVYYSSAEETKVSNSLPKEESYGDSLEDEELKANLPKDSVEVSMDEAIKLQEGAINASKLRHKKKNN